MNKAQTRVAIAKDVLANLPNTSFTNWNLPLKTACPNELLNYFSLSQLKLMEREYDGMVEAKPATRIGVIMTNIIKYHGTFTPAKANNEEL